jgi:hypothetical protein
VVLPGCDYGANSNLLADRFGEYKGYLGIVGPSDVQARRLLVTVDVTPTPLADLVGARSICVLNKGDVVGALKRLRADLPYRRASGDLLGKDFAFQQMILFFDSLVNVEGVERVVFWRRDSVGEHVQKVLNRYLPLEATAVASRLVRYRYWLSRISSRLPIFYALLVMLGGLTAGWLSWQNSPRGGIQGAGAAPPAANAGRAAGVDAGRAAGVDAGRAPPPGRGPAPSGSSSSPCNRELVSSLVRKLPSVLGFPFDENSVPQGNDELARVNSLVSLRDGLRSYLGERNRRLRSDVQSASRRCNLPAEDDLRKVSSALERLMEMIDIHDGILGSEFVLSFLLGLTLW